MQTPVSYTRLPAEKNKLITGTLTWENIDNKAEYKASGKGISYSTGAGIPLNALGLLSNMDPTVKAVSYTHLDVYKRQSPEDGTPSHCSTTATDTTGP